MDRTCSTGKTGYDSLEQAREALIRIRASRGYRQEEGPRGIYRCDLCHGYHFTSKPESEYGLDPADQERIDREREARYWENRIKRK